MKALVTIYKQNMCWQCRVCDGGDDADSLRMVDAEGKLNEQLRVVEDSFLSYLYIWSVVVRQSFCR